MLNISNYNKLKNNKLIFEKVYNIKYSQVVTHSSTNFTQQGLTLVIRREPVFYLWYGRRQKHLK